MKLWLSLTPWLLIGVPILAALSIWLIGLQGVDGDQKERRAGVLLRGFVVMMMMIVLLGYNFICIQAFTTGQWPVEFQTGDWFSSAGLVVPVALQIDGAAWLMATIVTVIGAITVLFSINYVHRETAFYRFFIGLLLFIAAMLLIVLSRSAPLTFAAWEIAGVCSYLLIAYNPERPRATANATMAFVSNRVGDAGFLIGLFFLWRWTGGLMWPSEPSAMQLTALQLDLLAFAFLIPALAKSAQFPFCAWITGALEGPTPSSAVFYGSLMVHAGIYLLIQLEPVLRHAPEIELLIGVLGILSILYGWLTSLVQTDVKSMFLFTNITQIGLMLLWVSLGWFDLALIHMALNAIWRAWQFLHAPSLMHMLSRGSRPVPKWMQNSRFLFTAALQRFWLEPMANWLLSRPINSIANELSRFDDDVVAKLIAKPAQGNVSANERQGVGEGQGVLGRTLQWFAERMEQFEHRLVLRGGGEGLTDFLLNLGKGLERIDQLLSAPRYLLLMVLVTIVIVL